MRGLHKSKTVSWASDIDLCQVKLFLSEESPSQVGFNAQDHLQAKTSLPLHSGGAGSDDILPPGFERNLSSNHLQIKPSQIPVIRWTNPPKIVLNLSWQVVAGEESEEVEDENQREMRVLEAIYPRPSSIPPNPSVSTDVENSHCTDGQAPSIPITPIEEEDAALDASSDFMASADVPLSSQPSPLAPGIPDSKSTASVQLARGVETDIASTSLALTNIIKSNEHGNFIDHELLNKILSNSEVIEKLVEDYGASDSLQYVPNARSASVAFSHPPVPVYQAETSAPLSAAFSASPSYPQPTWGPGGSIPTQWLPPPAVSPAKDVNYYKSLIQQHGGERQENLPHLNNRNIQQPVANQETTQNSRSRESKPKIMKPCIYFNSSRGCRNGANCAYQHDVAFQPRGSPVPGMQDSKRMKMDSEISS
ncbi:hypothetical protein L6164_024834 [Bauhinia variegata]|uniref:Uncharacterized protein n=1 Tax=Bauhinia variegata TaxID=167791 RepID=A0ACB9M180_BAUVA|nr:hypothetical protein L6164_024834 [Bauhinia variegata]